MNHVVSKIRYGKKSISISDAGELPSYPKFRYDITFTIYENNFAAFGDGRKYVISISHIHYTIIVCQAQLFHGDLRSHGVDYNHTPIMTDDQLSIVMNGNGSTF